MTGECGKSVTLFYIIFYLIDLRIIKIHLCIAFAVLFHFLFVGPKICSWILQLSAAACDGHNKCCSQLKWNAMLHSLYRLIENSTESHSHSHRTELIWDQTESQSQSSRSLCSRWKEHRLGKDLIQTVQYTQSALCELYEISHHICFFPWKNITASRKRCARTTWRVNPLYMQFITPFFSNSTTEAFQALWWFEAACFLSCTVHFSSLIPSLLEQSCVWRCVC